MIVFIITVINLEVEKKIDSRKNVILKSDQDQVQVIDYENLVMFIRKRKRIQYESYMTSTSIRTIKEHDIR
jgi:hypothetical protein